MRHELAGAQLNDVVDPVVDERERESARTVTTICPLRSFDESVEESQLQVEVHLNPSPWLCSNKRALNDLCVSDCSCARQPVVLYGRRRVIWPLFLAVQVVSTN